MARCCSRLPVSTIPVFLVLIAAFCVKGFVLPAPASRGGGALTNNPNRASEAWARGVGRVGVVGRSCTIITNGNLQARGSSLTIRRSSPDPDEPEIDIIRHREAQSHPDYWEDFYNGGGAGDIGEGDTYDWFFGYARMAVYLNLHVGGAREGRVLVLGCGNSEVSPKMWEAGWKNILNIDFSESVIEAMQRTHKEKPGLDWQVMDARKMAELETGSFDAVIDKGLTDSIMHNDKFAIMMAEMSLEIARLLKPGGVYLMTDYRDPERIQELFKRQEWDGGSLTQEGKITSKVNLFKGKRLVEDTKDPAEEENEGVDILVGETEGGVDETPDWLLNATKKNGNSIIDDTSDDIEVPRKDVGQNKPFKF